MGHGRARVAAGALAVRAQWTAPDARGMRAIRQFQQACEWGYRKIFTFLSKKTLAPRAPVRWKKRFDSEQRRI